MKLSIVIPCYNSEKMIRTVVAETVKYLMQLKHYEYEIVLVNDCSKDNTFEVIKQIVNNNDYIKGLDLAKNAGQHNAILAGLRVANGDYYIGMDDDMQTHPSQIWKLIERLEEGYDVVYGSYSHKETTGFRKLGSWFNNFTVAKLVGKPINMRISSFWIIRKFVRDEIISYSSSYTNLQGLFLRTTDRIARVEIEHFERLSGKSNYTIKKLVKLWSSVLNYSLIPVRIPFFLGCVGLFCCFVHLVLLFLFRKSWKILLHFQIICTGTMGAMLLLCLGITGEYLGRLFMSVMREPQSVVREYIESKNRRNETCNNRE